MIRGFAVAMAASSEVMHLMLVHPLHQVNSLVAFRGWGCWPCVVSSLKGCALFKSKQSDGFGNVAAPRRRYAESNPLLFADDAAKLKANARPITEISLKAREWAAVLLAHPAQRLFILANLASPHDDAL